MEGGVVSPNSTKCEGEGALQEGGRILTFVATVPPDSAHLRDDVDGVKSIVFVVYVHVW